MSVMADEEATKHIQNQVMFTQGPQIPHLLVLQLKSLQLLHLHLCGCFPFEHLQDGVIRNYQNATSTFVACACMFDS